LTKTTLKHINCAASIRVVPDTT